MKKGQRLDTARWWPVEQVKAVLVLPARYSTRSPSPEDGEEGRMKYTESILHDLSTGEWVCGSYWYSTARPTFSQRLSEVNRKQPGRITSRVCRRHDHNSTVHEYLDTTVKPSQLSWVAA